MDHQDVRRHCRPVIQITIALDADLALPLRKRADEEMAGYIKAVTDKVRVSPEYEKATQALAKLQKAEESAADTRRQLRDVESQLRDSLVDNFGKLVSEKHRLQSLLAEFSKMLPSLVVAFDHHKTIVEQSARSLADQASVQLLLNADQAAKQLDALVSGEGAAALDHLLICELLRGTSGSVTTGVLRQALSPMQVPVTADAGQVVQNVFDSLPGVQTGLQPQPDQWASFQSYQATKAAESRLVPQGVNP